ncbi:receptor kinase-like protein Xa21 [Zingiber officinale]|uniref:receptor kinase-like protein Xa21 n=1 Tax=Zingiber officinale TaxID=94328 RepID=UPI001C4A9BD3|nr:receptor kinase-like protein Xa21 [Zingiber officinale]
MNFGERNDPPHKGEKEVPEGAPYYLAGQAFVISGTLDRYLRANYLQGNIPPEIGELVHLTILDLSSNLLRGTIPPSIGSLNQLRFLNLSTNFLSGEVPTVGILLLHLNSADLIAKGNLYTQSREDAASKLLEKALKIQLGRGF